MSSSSRSAIVLELAEEFLERYRQGQRPSLKEYIDRHPELAAEIKDVFPAMALMENIALADESLAGDETPPGGQPPPESLQQLGDFRILREVGRGGMGIVYEAEQVSLGRHVALKVLPRKMLVDATQKRRFEREAKAAAKLHHTNIVPVFGVGEHDGLPYYVMQ
ncbi:MAG TPA: protein kinase, partial [Chloroflexota bacterium]